MTPAYVYAAYPVMNVTLHGDFRSLLASQFSVKVGGQPVSLVTLEQSRLVVTVDVMAYNQKLLHEVIVMTTEFEANTTLEIRS